MMKIAALIFGSLLALTVANAQTEVKTETKTETKTDSKKEKKAAKPADKTPAKTAAKEKTPKADLPKDIQKLIVQDVIQGNGKIATKGKKVKVNYTGWLYDPAQSMGRGKQFDSSEGGEPFTFELGGGQVIKGWDDGFENMKVGGKRVLIIPSEMGYGSHGAGNAIPPNAPLMFEVQLLDVM